SILRDGGIEPSLAHGRNRHEDDQQDQQNIDHRRHIDDGLLSVSGVHSHADADTEFRGMFRDGYFRSSSGGLTRMNSLSHFWCLPDLAGRPPGKVRSSNWRSEI